MENQLPSSYPSPTIPQQERTVGMWMHLGPFLAYLANFMIPVPFLSLITSLILYFSHREKEGFVLENGKESLNFQITLAIIWVVFFVVAALFMGSIFVDIFRNGYEGDDFDLGSGLSVAFGALPIMGFAVVLWLFAFIVMIIGSVRANEGNVYRYPLSIRFLK